MSSDTRRPGAGSPSDDDLAEADALLQKADALLRRHRFGPSEPSPATIDDDLPILTEIVDHCPGGADTSRFPTARVDLAEQLIELDTELNQEIESWFARELPQLLASELELLSAQLREKAIAHLRATLLPTLSARIASRLDVGSADDTHKPDRSACD